MAPGKPPVFAVCGGISVDTVVAGAGRRRSSVKTRRSAPAGGLAETLYADLLWDSGGANVENESARGVASPTETATDEDFADVFGGPPKFATLSFKRGMAKGSYTCLNGVSIFQSFVSAAPPINCTSAFNAFDNQPRLCSSQEAPGNLGPLSNSAKSTKQRLTTEAELSSRICYSDSDKKVFIHHKEEAVFQGDEIFTVMPKGHAGVKTSSTTIRRKASSRSDGGEEIKDSRGVNPSRNDFAMMKENIQEPSKGGGGDLQGQLHNEHEKMVSSSRGFQDASEKSACFTQNLKAERRRHNLKIKKKVKSDDLWVTIKDVQFATEPSRFPPPSRPPPSPKLHSDVTYIVRDTYEAVRRVDGRRPARSCQMLQKESFSDSGSPSSVCTQDSHTKMTSESKDIKDAMEMAEAKIRMVLEAREKAKLMVEKKLREKQRARQHKVRIASEDKLGKEHNCKEHGKDLREEKKPNVQYYEDDVGKRDEEGLRKRDLARQCIERATREVRSKSAAVVQEQAAELRVSDDISDRPVEDANEDSSAKSAIDSMTAEATPRWSDTDVDLPRRSSHKAVPAQVVDEENIPISMEHQQDSLSSSWCYTEQKRFCEASSLEIAGSMSRTYEDSNLFPGGNSWFNGFQEIIGEAFEKRKARWDRHCQTAERMAKALEEKKLRDLEHQKEQAERHRAGELLDEEIKGWAAGKEGNLEALLCSLHYVLWPECGWVRVSPADLTSAAAVKKAYRRATLCVHPDKVQQKGATVAQKYIAEKVFDLLKEASAKSM